jgi:hypothetical protein
MSAKSAGSISFRLTMSDQQHVCNHAVILDWRRANANLALRKVFRSAIGTDESNYAATASAFSFSAW